MKENLILDDGHRHGIARIAIPMNDPVIDPVAAIRKVMEHEAFCAEWIAEQEEKKRRDELKAKKAADNTVGSDWADLFLSANKDLVADIKAQVNGDEPVSVSEILARQQKAAKDLHDATDNIR